MANDNRNLQSAPASLAARVKVSQRLRQIADILGVPIERFFDPPDEDAQQARPPKKPPDGE